MAATVDLTIGSPEAPSALRATQVFMLERTVDFNASNKGGVNRDVNDVLQLIPVKKGWKVLDVGAKVLVKEGTGSGVTYDIGDGDQVDGWVDGVDADTVGVSATTAGDGFDLPAIAGKLYAADDTIDLKVLGAGVTAGKVRVRAFMLDYETD